MGDRVFLARKQLKRTQEEFANDCELKRIHYRAIETGKNNLSSVDPRRKLARGFGVPLETLEAYLDGKISLKAFMAQRGVGHRLNELQLRRIEERRLAIGVQADLVESLVGDSVMGSEIQKLPEQMRKALIGFLHVYGAPVDKAVILAKQLVEKYGTGEDPPFWFERLASRWKELPESGVRLATPEIKSESAKQV